MTFSLRIIVCALLGTQAGVSQAATEPPAPAVAKASLAASTQPLQEIGHVRAASAFCKNLAPHATFAVSAALAGNDSIADDEAWLSGVDLDQTEIAKARAVNSLTARYSSLREHAKAGMSEARAVTEAAKLAPSPQQRQALQRFGDALAGAMHRQELVADYLGRFVAYVQSHPRIDDAQQNANLNAAFLQPIPRFGGSSHSEDPRRMVPSSLSDTAKDMSSGLEARKQPMLEDEARAAEQIAPAFAPCA